jgi:ABC-2 type transport system ATP-binding protein
VARVAPPPAPREPLLSVTGLTRRFGQRVAVADLSFEIQPGECFGLLGPNGAGKSTTFQILAGLLRPDAGELRYRGEALSLTDPRLRVDLGVVFQKGSLDGALTARENLRLGGHLYGLSGKGLEERVCALLSRIGLLARADERVSAWSGGMRRRLELARALVHSPSVLLMDEPTQGLDEAAFQAFWSHLAQLREESLLTVLLTTHRSEEAARCDRLGVLEGGRLIALDAPGALAAQVGGDVVIVEGERPEEIAAEVTRRLGLSARVVDAQVHIERKEGHTLVPRLVEAFAPGRVSAVSVRRPTLADVFLKLSGRALGVDAAAPAEPARRR